MDLRHESDGRGKGYWWHDKNDKFKLDEVQMKEERSGRSSGRNVRSSSPAEQTTQDDYRCPARANPQREGPSDHYGQRLRIFSGCRTRGSSEYDSCQCSYGRGGDNLGLRFRERRGEGDFIRQSHNIEMIPMTSRTWIKSSTRSGRTQMGRAKLTASKPYDGHLGPRSYHPDQIPVYRFAMRLLKNCQNR